MDQSRFEDWFCVYCKEYCDGLVRNELTGLGFAIFAPTITEIGPVGDNGPMLPVVAPLFSQYVFVQHGPVAWQRAAHVRGANYLLGCTSRRGDPTVGTFPYTVPPRVMRELFERCNDKQQIILSPSAVPVVEPKVVTVVRPVAAKAPVVELSAGDRVRIVSGPFKDFEAMVKMSKRQRVDILLSVMGSEQQVRVPAHTLSRVM